MTVLTVDLVHHHTHSVLNLHGELDAFSSDLIAPAVDTMLDSGRQRLTVDTAGLTFCDSQGLRTLLLTDRKLAAAGGAMELVHVHGTLEDMKKVMRFFAAEVMPAFA